VEATIIDDNKNVVIIGGGISRAFSCKQSV